MGKTMSICASYKVEYQHTPWFNYQKQSLDDFFASFMDDYYSDEMADTIEVGKDSLEHLLTLIKRTPSKYDKALEKFGFDCNAEEFAERLGFILENTDPDNDFIRLEWF